MSAAPSDDARGLHLAGLTALQSGAAEAAAGLLGRAVAQDPGNAPARAALGMAQRSLGRLDEAAASLEAALALAPDLADARLALALAERSRGRPEAAIAGLERLVADHPGHVLGHYNLGGLLAAAGRLDPAAAAYGRAIALAPDLAEAHLNLGRILQAQDRLDEAAARYRRALEARPDYPAAHVNLGTALQAQGDVAGALACYERALALAPDLAAAHDNYGLALQELGDLAGAAACHRRAAALQPERPEAHNNLGIALYEMGDPGGALASFDRALAARPDHADTRHNRAMAMLQLGDLAGGFREYEWRWRSDLFRRTAGRPWQGAAPEWTGDRLDGRRILLHAEQGYGDALQFWRFLPLVAAQAAGVALEAPPALVRLFAGQGAGPVIAAGDPVPAADCRAALMSLPHRLGIDAAAIPAAPYLTADPGLAAGWRDRLGPVRGRRVGLVWASGLRPFDVRLKAFQRRKSVPFAALAPLFALPGLEWISLQTGGEAAAAAGQPAVRDLSAGLADFADTAAVIAGLDLVVTVDTAVAHLAGALGRPVWILLPHIACWRWLRERDDTPWYPSARLFRQAAAGDWPGVVGRVAAALQSGF